MAGKYERRDDSELRKLKAALKAGAPEKLYFFYGEESYLKEYYLAALKKKLLAGAMEEFNFRRITAENMQMDALRLAVDAMPMLAERVLVQVDDYNPFAAPETERDAFIALISDLPDTCCLVFYYDTIPYAKDGKKKKLSAAIAKCGHEVEFARQTAGELSDWVSRHFRSEGKNIPPELCQYLVFRTGGSMHALASEIQKLTAYCSGPEIRKDDIDAVVEQTLSAAAFDLTDALAQKEYDAALSHLSSMLRAQEEPISILAAIGTHFRRLLTAKTVRSTGGGAAQLMELIGTNSDFYARKLMGQADRLDEAFCRRAVIGCFEADQTLKSSSADESETLELLVLKLVEKENL